jgi:hypothetical protein
VNARAVLAWLLELIRRAPEPIVTGPAAGPAEAIELVIRGRTFRIVVEEVVA